MKLTQDQKESLDELTQSPTWEAVLAVCQMATESWENRVITSDLSKGDREIALNKARLEGAKDVHRALFNIREIIGGSRKAAK